MQGICNEELHDLYNYKILLGSLNRRDQLELDMYCEYGDDEVIK
jgi:hypothetical protein